MEEEEEGDDTSGGEAWDAGAEDAVQAHRLSPQEGGRDPPQVPPIHRQHRPGRLDPSFFRFVRLFVIIFTELGLILCSDLVLGLRFVVVCDIWIV